MGGYTEWIAGFECKNTQSRSGEEAYDVSGCKEEDCGGGSSTVGED
jgi:hypothetical protein